MAWCSTGQARVFHYLYNGMLQGDMINKDYRFHPTQKPTQLWTKILNFYTKEGDLILDAFAGSQSLRIACHKMNRKYIGFEIDEDKIVPEANLFEDLEFDSIDAVDLAVRLQDFTKQKISPENFKQIKTINDVVDAVDGLLQ